jgi:hypothetical protein
MFNLTNPIPVNVSLLAVKTNLPKQVSKYASVSSSRLSDDQIPDLCQV